MNHPIEAVWRQATVTRARRELVNGHRVGLSGSGKSTQAHCENSMR